MNINLHIDRVVLDGINLDAHQRPIFHQALQTELTRLLTSGGFPPGSVGNIHKHRLEASGIQFTENQQPMELAQKIAGAVLGGLTRE